jgi:hypothetical protein
MRETLHHSATDGYHFTVRLVVLAKIVLFRFSIDNIEEELLKLVIAGPGPQWLSLNTHLTLPTKA